jgi:hypothetical protein
MALGLYKILRPSQGRHASNLTKHIKKKHPVEYAKLEEESSGSRDSVQSQEKRPCDDPPPEPSKKQQTLEYCTSSTSKQANADRLLGSCMELATVNGRPFAMFSDSGFRKILELLQPLLPKQFSVNPTKVSELVSKRAALVRQKISDELKNSLICLKMDCATRLDRSFLGVNAQFTSEVEPKLVLRTLGMVELDSRHTSEYLKEQVYGVLSKYRVQPSQIFSCTVDNGANMLKTIRLIDEEVLEQSNADHEDDNEVWMDDASDLDLNLPSHFGVSKHLVTPIRCAAHTLQLAVEDALKESSPAETITRARVLAKKLRTQAMLNLIKQLQLPKPMLDCPTRWSATHDMLKRLLELKGFCNDSEATENLSSSAWETVADVVKGLEHAKHATLLLQKEQLTVGDFYGIWLECKLKTKKVNTPLARALINHMERREINLLTSDVFVSAVFLDPRYSVLLDEQAKARARMFVTKTAKRLAELKSRAAAEMSGPSSTSDESLSVLRADPEDEYDVDDPLEDLLKSRQCDDTSQATGNDSAIHHALRSLEQNSRLPKEENVLHWWIDKKENPLYEVARVILAVPATQVSVERLFSGLKFILNPQRNCLGAGVVDDILVTRCNAAIAFP